MRYGIVERLVSFTITHDYVLIVLDGYMIIFSWKVVLTMLNPWAMYEFGWMKSNLLLHIWNYNSP